MVSGTARDGLALAGILVLVLGGAGMVLPVRGEALEWTLWALLGAIVPVAVLWLARGPLLPQVRWALAAAGLAGIVLYCVLVRRWVAVPLAVGQWLLDARLRHERLRMIDLLVAVGAWSALGALGRKGPILETLAGYVASPTPGRILASVAGVAAITASLALRDRRCLRAPPAARHLLTVAALAVIGLESLRVDYLFDSISAIHHWGVFTGPAETVRHGGWLLWDTPATYGFLSTLAIAFTPTTSVWDGFFLLNALACAASATVLFLVLRNHLHAPLALILSVAAVLALPGGSVLIFGAGVLVTPNAGPFRFVWCQLLLGLVALGTARPPVLVGGTLVWLVGCLWSAESAAYCSATWLPAYALMVWGRPIAERARWLALPAGLLAGALAMISGWYVAWLGHGPDWSAFFEAAMGVGAVALPIDPWGPVAVLLLVVWAVGAAAAAAVRSADVSASLPPLCAAFGALWATGSYFVGRSHFITVTNLLPTCCLAGAVVLPELGDPDHSAVRGAIAAVFAGALLLAIHEPSGWWPRRPLPQRWALGVEALRPSMSPELTELMRVAGIGASTPVVYYDADAMPAWPSSPAARQPVTGWLPVMPFEELVPVPEARRRLYVERFGERTRRGGWLIEVPHSLPVEGGGSWFFDELTRLYKAGPQHEVGRWRATRYDYVGEQR